MSDKTRTVLWLTSTDNRLLNVSNQDNRFSTAGLEVDLHGRAVMLSCPHCKAQWHVQAILKEFRFRRNQQITLSCARCQAPWGLCLRLVPKADPRGEKQGGAQPFSANRDEMAGPAGGVCAQGFRRVNCP